MKLFTNMCVRQHFLHDKIVIDFSRQFASFVMTFGFFIVLYLIVKLKVKKVNENVKNIL